MLGGLFDDTLIMNQLESISAIAYLQLIRSGFPIRVLYTELLPKYDKYIHGRARLNQHRLCREILCTIGFKSREFKLDKEEVLFRPHNSHLHQALNRKDSDFIKEISDEVNKRFAHKLWKSLRIFWKFYFMCKL